MDDPVKIAEDLLNKSNFILSNIDSWKHLPLEKISEKIDEKPQELKDNSVQKVIQVNSLLAEINSEVKKGDTNMNTDRDHQKNYVNKSKRHKWKHEILSKIECLERELEDMKLAYERQDKILHKKDELLLDIVSSQSSSPVKSKSTSLVSKTSYINGIKRPSNIKANEILEAKQIMERNLKTAREMNEKWELWKRKQKTRRDVSLQASLPEVKSTQSDQETKICYLAEKLTNLLLEQPDKNKKKKILGKNIGNSVLISSKNAGCSKEPCERLSVQRLPDNSIKDALSTQTLPSIVIPPTSIECASVYNTKLFCLNHSSKADHSHITSYTKQVSPNNNSITVQTKVDRTDIGLQVDFSESNSSSSEISIENKLRSLEIRNKSLIDDYNETQRLRDLLKKVEESSKVCKKYRSSKSSLVSNLLDNNKSDQSGLEVDLSDSISSGISLEDKLRSLERRKTKIVDDYNETKLLRDLLKNVEEPNKVSKNNRRSNTPLEVNKSVQSSTKSSKKISSVYHVDDYKSDFEVESLEKDNRSLTSSLSKISSIENLESLKLNKTPSIGSRRSKTSSLAAAENKICPTASHTVSTDESLLEAQMKRLGISPERTMLPRKPADLTVKNIKRIYKDRQIHRTSSPKSRNPTYRKTLYVKSDGMFIPVDPLDQQKVQIIVPEIVVKLPESINAPTATAQDKSPSSLRRSPSAVHLKQDQLIQTDEGFGPLTFGNTSSIVDKLNNHFERTQLLLERIGSMGGNNVEQHPNSNMLSLLHPRRTTNGSCGIDKNGLETSPGEIKKTGFKVPRPRSKFPYKEELNTIENNSESIGEISNHYR